jgi:hypothetical protein
VLPLALPEPLPPIPLVPPLPAGSDDPVLPAAPEAPLEPVAPVLPDAPAVPLELMPLAPAPGVFAVVSPALDALELGAMPPLAPVPAAPGVLVDVELCALLFAVDRSFPQPASANASATLAAMVSSLVISKSS